MSSKHSGSASPASRRRHATRRSRDPVRLSRQSRLRCTSRFIGAARGGDSGHWPLGQRDGLSPLRRSAGIRSAASTGATVRSRVSAAFLHRAWVRVRVDRWWGRTTADTDRYFRRRHEIRRRAANPTRGRSTAAAPAAGSRRCHGRTFKSRRRRRGTRWRDTSGRLSGLTCGFGGRRFTLRSGTASASASVSTSTLVFGRRFWRVAVAACGARDRRWFRRVTVRGSTLGSGISTAVDIETALRLRRGRPLPSPHALELSPGCSEVLPLSVVFLAVFGRRRRRLLAVGRRLRVGREGLHQHPRVLEQLLQLLGVYSPRVGVVQEPRLQQGGRQNTPTGVFLSFQREQERQTPRTADTASRHGCVP